jgi:hypothetical protein
VHNIYIYIYIYNIFHRVLEEGAAVGPLYDGVGALELDELAALHLSRGGRRQECRLWAGWRAGILREEEQGKEEKEEE